MIPQIEITDVGYNVPTTQAINQGVWQVLQGALGSNISQVQGTPQYQLATSFTAIIRDVYDHFVELANQFDPRYADGIYQDAIGQLYFMSRKTATHSVCEVTFQGLSGAPIPSGFIVQDTAGNQWQTLGDFNISNTGIVKAQVECLTVGAVEANIDSINIIPTALNGLERVYNEASAIAGYDEEDRADFEIRREESVAINGKMTDEATRGAVLSVANVVDCYVQSNPTDQTVTFGVTEYPAIRNSIVVSVVGGNDYTVAKEAFIKAGTGCAWNGNTDVTVYDDSYDGVKPAYPIKILRPDFVNIYFKVLVSSKDDVTAHDENTIKDFIVSSSASGKNRMRIGKTIVPSAFICGLPSVGIISVLVSMDGTTWLNKLPIGIDQYPSVDRFRITVEEYE